MTHTPRTEYLKTQVMTASPEMLTLMLWDGAIRFAEQGKDAILKKDIEGSYKTLIRAQKIITELSASLRRDINPDLTDKLAALYGFIYRRLVDANLNKDPGCVDDALEIMRLQRETWVLLMEKLATEKAQAARPTVDENTAAIAASATIDTPTAPPELVGAGSAPARAPARRGLYAGLAMRPTPAASLSVQG